MLIVLMFFVALIFSVAMGRVKSLSGGERSRGETVDGWIPWAVTISAFLMAESIMITGPGSVSERLAFCALGIVWMVIGYVFTDMEIGSDKTVGSWLILVALASLFGALAFGWRGSFLAPEFAVFQVVGVAKGSRTDGRLGPFEVFRRNQKFSWCALLILVGSVMLFPITSLTVGARIWLGLGCAVFFLVVMIGAQIGARLGNKVIT
jgi:hypothetical protein